MQPVAQPKANARRRACQTALRSLLVGDALLGFGRRGARLSVPDHRLARMKLSATATSSPEETLAAAKVREERYRLGQFFTPTSVAELMAARVMEIDPGSVLDPGVGGGILLRSLPETVPVYGLDIDPDAVAVASESLQDRDSVEIQQGDFLSPSGDGLLEDASLPLSRQTFDAIIANPPYIKHHMLSPQLKTLLKRRYEHYLGVRVSKLSSIYIYFFLESIRRLEPGGRLVFITPTEFLDVSYGRAVKEALLGHCSIDEIIVYGEDELTFGDDVLSTSAITVATRRAPSRRLATIRVREMTGPSPDDTETAVIEKPDPSLPWTGYTPGRARERDFLLAGRPRSLGDYARARRGIATGKNSFFCLTREEVDRWGIEEEFLVPCLIGARDLPSDGSPVTDDHMRALEEAGRRCMLLWCHEPKEALEGKRVLGYILHGERECISEAYNCRSRDPWYSVEPVDPPDWFVTYMSRDNARFSRNLAGARCLTSLLNVWALDGVDKDRLDAELSSPMIPRLLRATGRNYGGGLGKIEPSELRRLPLPDLD